MQLLDRRTFLALTAGSAAAALARPAQAGLAEAQVFTADPFGGVVDSTVILGDDAAVLIDAQFTLPNATRLADVIAATGKRLETIFITHYHPDHHLGLAAIMDRFPDAQPVAHPAIQPKIAGGAQAMLDNMRAGQPDNFATRVVIPEALSSDAILLEGERIEVLEPMHGDTDLISAVHIPALDTLVASDFAYTGTHAWVAENTTPDKIDMWRASLSKLEAIGAGTIVPGHRSADAMNDASAFAATRAYLDQWEAALAETSTADDLRAAMMQGNEGLGLGFALDRAIGAVYPG
ncbi:MAG: MBL fold metallo-hydrolase [Rhodobacter sp.]|nr:MBL fold metallo-hydrolase [Rhodobacter sp.]